MNSLPALSVANVAVRQHDGLYSLNDLHKAAGGAAKHKPSNFLRNEQAIALIGELTNAQIRALETIKGGTAPGTFACRELVIAYAAWISPAFHLQVIRVFLDSVTPHVQPQPQLPLYPEPTVTLDATTLYRISLVVHYFKQLHGVYRDFKLGQALAWLGSPVAAKMYDRFIDGMNNVSVLERQLGKDFNVARRYLHDVHGINTGGHS